MPFCCKCGRAPLVERVRFDFVENRQGLKKFYCQRVAAVPSIRASAPLDRGSAWELGGAWDVARISWGCSHKVQIGCFEARFGIPSKY